MAQSPARRSPYQGLIPYTERDAQFFFGREKETRLTIANLFASPLTLLYGPSGVGKSSILRAGITHQLNQRPNVKVVIYSEWKNNPLVKLKSLAGVVAGLPDDYGLRHSFAGVLKESTRVLNSRLMIILDQFEEYFLYHPVEDDFTDQFSRATIRADLPISFLISIREDSLAKLDRFEGRIPILFDNYLRLEHLDDDAARSAIERPIEKFNQIYVSDRPMHIEARLVDEVLEQLKSGQVSLETLGQGVAASSGSRQIETPYLQLVMTRLWAEELGRKSRTLHLETLEKLGGAETIVKSHLDLVMKRLSSDHQLLASKVFQYLVTPSGTKIALSADDLSSFVDVPAPVVKSLLQRLSEQDVRLLRAAETREKTDVTYEIFHDVLAAPILEWRERWQFRYRLKNRTSLVGVAFLLVGIYAILVFLVAPSDVFNTITEPGVGFSCLLPLLCMVGLFGVIGFVTGVNWTRTR
jgi:hypothetical protein